MKQFLFILIQFLSITMIFTQDHGIFSLDTQLEGEKYIQLEKYGSAKVKKYRVGAELTFFVNGEWRTEYIENVISKDSIIVFTNGYSKVTEIEKLSISSWRQRFFLTQKKALIAFGGAWAFYSLFDPDNYKTNYIFSGSIITSGFLLGTLAKPKIIRLKKKKHRLRLMEIKI